MFRDGLIKRTSFVFDEIALKIVHKDQKGDRAKTSKKLNRVKPVENRN